MFDPDREKFKYIYWKIYKPVLDLNQKIASHETHFKWHRNGSEKNDTVMADFICKIESLFIENTTKKLTMDDGQETQITYIQNKLVHATLKELNGRFYDIMYGKKKESEDS